MDELMGKEVKFVDRENTIDCKAIVVVCDTSIGITIVAKEDKEKYLLCLVRPGSPLWIDKYFLPRSDAAYAVIEKCIIAGVVDMAPIMEVWNAFSCDNTETGRSSAETCPLGYGS